MRRAILASIVTATVLLPVPGWAMAPSRAGILPLEAEGNLPPNGAEGFSAKVSEGIASAGVTVVTEDELAQAAGGSLAACSDETCLRELSATASAPRLVRPMVRLDESDYVITLEVIDGATGRVVDQVSQSCELCGLNEALEVAGTLAASLETQLAAPATGTVTIETTPAGAQVLVDGELAGTSPLELTLSAGEHTIMLRQDGYTDQTRRVRVEAGSAAAVAAELDAGAPRHDGLPADRRALLRPIGWASLGVGIASLGAGIAMLALDQKPVEYTRCSGIDVDVEGNCRFRHDTLAGGVVMTIVGVVGITAGALLIARTGNERSRDDARRARLRPTSRGIAILF